MSVGVLTTFISKHKEESLRNGKSLILVFGVIHLLMLFRRSAQHMKRNWFNQRLEFYENKKTLMFSFVYGFHRMIIMI